MSTLPDWSSGKFPERLIGALLALGKQQRPFLFRTAACRDGADYYVCLNVFFFLLSYNHASSSHTETWLQAHTTRTHSGAQHICDTYGNGLRFPSVVHALCLLCQPPYMKSFLLSCQQSLKMSKQNNACVELWEQDPAFLSCFGSKQRKVIPLPFYSHFSSEESRADALLSKFWINTTKFSSLLSDCSLSPYGA